MCIRDSLSARCILVADDDEMILTVATTALTMHGYTVLKARDGEEALALYRAHRHEVSLLLIDDTMPRASGREVIGAIRAENGTLPIIWTSGSGEPISSDASGSPLTRSLPKPYPLTELLKEVRELIGADPG